MDSITLHLRHCAAALAIAACNPPDADAPMEGGSATEASMTTTGSSAADAASSSVDGDTIGPTSGVTSPTDTGGSSEGGQSTGDDPPEYACTEVDLGDSSPVIYEGTTSGSASANIDPVCGDWFGGGSEVFHEWTAPADGTYTLSVEGTGIDAVIARVPSCGAYYNDCPVSAEQVELAGGETILFAVTDWYGEEGEYRIEIDLADV